MSLKTSKKVETNVYELEISVDAETFEQAVQKAYKKLKNKVAVPGFRKGKATRGMIEKLYGKEVFYEEAMDIVYPDAVESAIKEADLKVVDMPFDVEITEISANGAEIKLKVTVCPEIELGDYKALEATKKPVSVSDADVDAEIANMQDRNARFVEVEGRAIENGDLTSIDFEGFTDGVAFEGGKAENYDLTIGSNQFIPGFEEQLVGHNAGDEFEINVKFPEDYAENLAGKDAMFKIKVNDIKQKELPELNDDFAKDVSEFDTIAELKADLKTQMEKRQGEEAEAQVDDQLLEQLAGLVKAEIPDAMIERKIEESINEFSYRMQSQGMDFDTYLKFTGSSREQFKESIRPKAETQVKIDLALDKIVADEKVEVSEEDLKAEYQKMADMYNVELDVIKGAVPEDNIKSSLQTSKALELIKSTAKVSEEKAEAKKPAEKKTTTKKTAAKKPAAKKTTTKKAADKDTEKKPAAKKTTTKKTTTKKTTTKKTTTAKKPAAKKTTKKADEE